MSRTIRRKNKVYYNTVEDFLSADFVWWQCYMGIPKNATEEVRRARFVCEEAKYHSDAHAGDRCSILLKQEENSKRRAKETTLLNKVKTDWEYNPEFLKRYGNLWNWD